MSLHENGRLNSHIIRKVHKEIQKKEKKDNNTIGVERKEMSYKDELIRFRIKLEVCTFHTN